MDYTGLFPKFKINRPLTDEERELRFDQKKRIDCEPVHQLAVIKINSTYLETTDKFYAWTGWLATGMLLVGLLVTVSLVATHIEAWAKVNWDEPFFDEFTALNVMVAITIMFTPIIIASIWGFKLEAFRYTHYPIRFNRKTRMVHAFRFDGTVISAPWDDLFFTLGRGNRRNFIQNWDIRAHVIDIDGVTVRDTFSLGLHFDEKEALNRFWELHRRYMEEGPQSISSIVQVYMPIAEKRETFWFGFQRWRGNMLLSPIAFYLETPAALFSSVGRWVAMQTSKVPQWPTEIEDACKIEPNDPYRRDERDNPKNMWG